MTSVSLLKTSPNCGSRVRIILSPKSQIKVHRLNFNETPKIPPEIAIRGNCNQTSNDDMDKITQAWNKLKITALSKAVAMAPDVGFCSIGPNSPETGSNELDNGDSDKPDLSKAITSTPLKSRNPIEKIGSSTKRALSSKHDIFDISEIKSDSEENDNRSFETVRVFCLNRYEAQINKTVQKRREEFLQLCKANDEKTNEKLAALKMEMDRERLLRIQEQYLASQKLLMEAEACAQYKEQQQQQQRDVDHEKRLAETGEKIKQIEHKRKELEEKQKRKREELKQYITGIHEMQIAYRSKYNQITELTQICKDVQALNQRVVGELPKMKGMNELLLRIVSRCTEGKATLQDLKSAQMLVQQITNVCEIFSQQVVEINKEVEKSEEEEKKKRWNEHVEKEKEQRSKQEEAERQQKVRQEKEKVEKDKPSKNQITQKLSSNAEDCVSLECLKWHLELSKFLENYENKLEPLLNDNAFKKFRFDCQKVVNVPVNAISPLDDLHMEDKYYKLSRLLQGQAVPLDGALFFPTGHPLGVAFCTNYLAKKFVNQGEHTVSSKPDAAFALAAVIVSLWVDFPDFGRLLLAHFHRKCPYLIPAFLPQVEGQSDEQYYKMLGYQYSSEGKVEAQDKFLRRMTGIMRLYAAVLVTPLKRSHVAEGKQHPHSMKDAWRWIAASLNLSPRPDISPTLLFDFLEVAGGALYRTYGAQFSKLLHLLCGDYFPLIEQVTPEGCGGPVVRLKSFLEKILKEGQVPFPTGLLPPNFW